LAFCKAGFGTRSNHAAGALVPGHQRILEPGERRHAAGVQKLFGTGADAGPVGLDNDVGLARLAQRNRRNAQLFRFVQDHCEGLHICTSRFNTTVSLSCITYM
jgi:hypothetical protein